MSDPLASSLPTKAAAHPPAAVPPPPPGTRVQVLAKRYRLGRRIGVGGFGEVFEAEDLLTRSRVAVKRLLQGDATALFLFKQEFRLLADLAHAHLVKYHELIQEGAQWYLVMEYVPGLDLYGYVRSELGSSGASGVHTQTLPLGDATAITPTPTPVFSSVVTRLMPPSEVSATSAVLPAPPQALGNPLNADQLRRLRRLLPQLAEGLRHLHSAGLVHRDITPNNMLVEPSGRLVLLDFGLALRLQREDEGQAQQRLIAGTLKYMAPEQASGEDIGPAADWFAVGAVLYHLLTGLPPYQGTLAEIRLAKRLRPVPDPRRVCPGLPGDLCDWCVALLDPDPARRPLGLPSAAPTTTTGLGSSSFLSVAGGLPFVGRARQLSRLQAAHQAAGIAATTQVLVVHGPSGIGKSALLAEYARQIRHRGGLVLHGRCYERESLPFKALDGLVDALAAHLGEMGDPAASRLLPRYTPYLARLFPVLLQVGAVQARAGLGKEREAIDPHEMRRRGFLALREILIRLSEQRSVVLMMDDVQWGDADSIEALLELLAPPDPPPLLVLASCRSGEADERAQLQHWMHALREGRVPVDTLELGPLEADESDALAHAALADHGSDASGGDAQGTLLGNLRRESGGHPLLLLELAHANIQAPARLAAGRTLDLAGLLRLRMRALGEGARNLLCAAAVAGRPRPLDLLQRSAALGQGANEALAELRAERLARTQGAPGMGQVAVFHDAVAQVALGLLDAPMLSAMHLRLAQALEERDGDSEAEALYRHYDAAAAHTPAHQPKALHYAVVAAERAAAALAFDRAAALWQAAIALAGSDAAHVAELKLKLGDALANAGRGYQAAQAYRQGGESQSGERRRYALRRAACQYLRSGYMDDGIAVSRQALIEVGVPWRERPSAALFSLLWLRVRLWWGGYRFRHTPSVQTLAQQAQMDTLWDIAHGLGGVDTIRGAEFHARHLLHALASGDLYRISKGMAWEAILAFAEGGASNLARGWRLVDHGAGLAARIGNQHARAWNSAAAGYGHWCQGEFAKAVQCSRIAATGYREECHDITWELGSVLAWCHAPVLAAQGDLDGLRQLATDIEREFGQLGDLYTVVTLRVNAKPLLHLADDRPDRARAEASAAIAQWSLKAWHLQHLFEVMTQAKADIYEGKPAAAWQRIAAVWSKSVAAMHTRLQIKRIFAQHLRSIAAINAALSGQGEPAWLRQAERDRARMAAEGLGWAKAHADALGAGMLAITQPQAAAAAYLRAATAYQVADMHLYALAAQRRAAQLGQGNRDAVDAALRARGVVEPGRLSAVLVPGPAVE